MVKRSAPPIALIGILLAAAVARADSSQFLNRNYVPTLPQAVQTNLRSVVRVIDFGGRAKASGFLVHVNGRRALALTNAHVTKVVTTAGMRLRLFDGQDAIVNRIVYERPYWLDFSLLEVTLPPTSTAIAARLRNGRVKPGERAYSVGTESIAFNEEGQTEEWTLHTGDEVDRGAVRQVTDVLSGMPKLSNNFKMTSLPGNSGRPFFSAAGHDVVGLHWGSNRIVSSVIPSRLILEDLSLELQGNRFDAATSQAIAQMIRSASR